MDQELKEQLIARSKQYDIWNDVDLSKFPWPCGRSLFDLVAAICNRKLLILAKGDEAKYYKMLGEIETEVFGCTNPERAQLN